MWWNRFFVVSAPRPGRPKKNRFWCNMRNACKSQPASQPAKNAPKIENAMLNSFYRIYDLKCILLIVYRILMSIFCASTNKFRARYATEKKLKGGKTEQTMLFFGGGFACASQSERCLYKVHSECVVHSRGSGPGRCNRSWLCVCLRRRWTI